MPPAPLRPAWREFAKRLPGARPLVLLARRIVDPDYREIHRLQAQAAEQLFQPYPTTQEERYPQLFDALAERLAHLPSPRLLSFGCSSGAEVRALRRRMPGARITGLDLNRRMIERAVAADPDPLSTYRIAGAPQPDERFDAVLAMAVFRHGELELQRPDSCTRYLPFARFAEGLAMLDAVLEPRGWLALYNQHFRLSDTRLAARYRAEDLTMAEPLTLLYGPDDRRLDGVSETAALFRKLEV